MSVAKDEDFMDEERTENVLIDVWDERDRQNKRWGVQNLPDGTDAETWAPVLAIAREGYAELDSVGALSYLNILQEEVLEAFTETDPQRLREELIQVAAVAVAWVEKLDRERAVAQ